MKKNGVGISFQIRKPGLLLNEDQLREFVGEQATEDHAKLLLLCEHFGIQSGPNMFYQLALTLARQLYPQDKKAGKPQKWTGLNRGALVVEVDRLKHPGDATRGVAWACQQLSKREPWASFVEATDSLDSSPDPAEALRRTYYASIKEGTEWDKWVETAKGCFALHEHNGTLAEWDALVADVVNNPFP
ncbi:hypothetical protein ACN9M1_17180 [Ralstonia sp. R-29]|uniref:hypothetical protein n=1 Tax=Ralstonia sp. R-29 TaxID=3404059 RepID=UPI003CF366A7